MTTLKSSPFQFSRDHTKKPFEIAGRTFFGKPLTAAEEDLLQEHQLLGFTRKPSETLTSEVTILRQVLERRAAGSDDVPAEWVAEHVGRANADHLIVYLRTGSKEHGALDLPMFPEPIEIDGQVYAARAMSFREQSTVVAALDELNAAETITEVQSLADKPGVTVEEVGAGAQRMAHVAHTTSVLNAELLATLLNARAPEGAEPLTADQLRDELPAPAIVQLTNYLRDGSLPDDGSEADVPNA